MTKFSKDNLVKDGDYLMYSPTGWAYAKDAQFVARFKNGRGGAGSFKTFLIKNFTVEEYFGLRAKGDELLRAGVTGAATEYSPLSILEKKGYIQPHVKKWMKEAGYMVFTAETKEHWFQNVYCKHFTRKVA